MSQKKISFIILKFIFAGAALFFLFHKVNISQLEYFITHARPIPILLGILFCWLTIFIAAWRWHQLLKIFEIQISFWSLFCITQIGQFFLIFLPGPAGDDITRMLYITRCSKEKKGEACTTVIIDRIIGLASVLFIALICIPWQWNMLLESPQVHYVPFGILSLGSLVTLLGLLFFFFAHPSHYWFSHSLKIFRNLTLRDEISRIAGLICSKKTIIAQVIAAAITTQFLLCAMFYLAGKAVGINAPFIIWLGFVPIILATNALPITIAGIGIREYLMVLFLGVLAHIDNEHTLAASFVVFSMMLVVCLFGGIVYIIYRPAIQK